MAAGTPGRAGNADPAELLAQLADLIATALAPKLAAQLANHQQPADEHPRSARLLTLDELVAQLPKGKSPATWKRWLYERTRKGQIPGCHKLGNTLFFDPDQTLPWLIPPVPPSDAEPTG